MLPSPDKLASIFGAPTANLASTGATLESIFTDFRLTVVVAESRQTHVYLRCQHVGPNSTALQLHQLSDVGGHVSDIVGTVADVGRDFLHPLGVECSLFLCHGTS